ncbi:MAG TPA: SpoIIE family protein phosphatase [Thermoanaerobaculia bacterium]|nr:SpoIIE family protein phosphatase [Thermoanaerobaculia bacterium]
MEVKRFLEVCGERLRSAVIAIVAGVIFSLIYSLGRGEQQMRHWVAVVSIGAIVGLTIWLCVWMLLALFRDLLARQPDRIRPFLSALLYLVAGVVGWFFGVLLASRIFGQHITPRDLVTGIGAVIMLVSGGIAVVVGLVFRTIDIMKDRLAESIEKLKQHEWAEKELELARSIQKRLLPPQRIEGDGFSIAARNFPAHFVAGDFYDVVQLADGSIAIVVADVAGKGMGASLIMASVKAVLPFVGRESVEEAMQILNDKLVQELDRREFVALAYARFSPADGTLHLANAGFPDPYLVRDSSVQPLTVSGVRLPLGIRGDVKYQTMTTKLQPRDRLVFVSDGIPEAPVEGDQPFGYERLTDALRGGGSERADEWLEQWLKRIRGEVLEPLTDDWTALVLEFTARARIAAA